MEGVTMVDRFPLLDGSEIDLDTQVDPHPDVEHRHAVSLRADWAQEQLTWWQTYVTDNGPTTPSFAGLATSGGKTTITLDTGATSSDDHTAILGPTINWDNWTEIRSYVVNTQASGVNGRIALSLADGETEASITEGFRNQFSEGTGNSGRVYTGGADQNKYRDGGVSMTNTHTWGFRIYNNPTGSGHQVDWTMDGQFEDSWSEGEGFPNATDLDFSLSVTTTDGNQLSYEIDAWIIELIP